VLIAVTTATTAWQGRYSRRKSILSGAAHGQPADALAHQMLVARLRDKDASETGTPDWNSDTRFPIDRTYQFMGEFIGVRSASDPHQYGPSLRRLWLQAKRAGASDREAWNQVRAWARHRPAAWDMEDRRKKKRSDPDLAALGTQLARAISWTSTGDLEIPWATDADGVRWHVRLNDFPDDYMYTLLIGGREIGRFNDWPSSWTRSDDFQIQSSRSG